MVDVLKAKRLNIQSVSMFLAFCRLHRAASLSEGGSGTPKENDCK
jgi:hypothetical protein